MLFSSISFVYYFLPAVLLVYFTLPFKLKNYWLLLSSLLFYFWGEPGYTLLMLFSIAANYALGLAVAKNRGNQTGKRYLAASIVLCIVMLGFFKYADFIIGILNSITGLSTKPLRIPLPLGISFYTFQIMSYTIDVYRGETDAQRNPLTLAAYVSLFPQLVAGPIVRYKTVESALYSRRLSVVDFATGAERFVIGLSKKVLLANQLGELFITARDASQKSVLLAWLAVIAFALQVYFDFSGYSDMAIGMGRMLGFRFPENFNYPFISKSVSEFWRRWHISLGTWFREYLYIPLGGSRAGRLRLIRNMFIVWLCTGLWHGASWNFAVWGLYFGVLLCAEKLVLRVDAWPDALRRLYTLLAAAFSFVIFSSDTLPEAARRISDMLWFSRLPLSGAETLYTLKSAAVLLVFAVIGSTPVPAELYRRLNASFKRAAAVIEPAAFAVLLVLCTAYLADSTYNPFLYFRF